MRLTPADARVLLRERAQDEYAEERLDPPSWAPFRRYHDVREVVAADVAAATRREHALALADASDTLLARMIADGWDPRHTHRRR